MSRTCPAMQEKKKMVALLLLAGQSWPFSDCEFHEECHVSVVLVPLQVHLGLSNLH